MRARANRPKERPILRFVTCGSVDDGKSTLIGRMLFEADQVCRDHLDSLCKNGAEPDYAHLLDGIEAEREQGITIDLAYRSFSTRKRRFIVADAPGHEQYTRNMATGASISDLAVILIDARTGLKPQTKRHSAIAQLFGVRHVLLVVNKMDLVGYDREVFAAHEKDYTLFAKNCGFSSVFCLPVSALKGENICKPSPRMSWFVGPSFLSFLDDFDPASPETDASFRFPVQWVCRPNASFRGYAGTVRGGALSRGDKIIVCPSGETATIASIVTANGPKRQAAEGEAVMLTLDCERDISRGDVIAAADAPPQIGDQVEARLLWLSRKKMETGRLYTLRCGPQKIAATIASVQTRLDIDTLEKKESDRLATNEVGIVTVSFAAPLSLDPFSQNRFLGSFVLCDRLSHETVAVGCVQSIFRCGTHVQWQKLTVDAASRETLKKQKACCLWLTGLSGSGKSTIADLLEKRLYNLGYHTYILDGDNVRHGLNRDLGFSVRDRAENIRRVAEVARLMVDAGLIVIVSFISPFRNERALAKSLFPHGSFFEIHVDAPLALCEKRDPKGLYKKARKGLIPEFTGLTSPYEIPESPDLHLRTDGESPAAHVDVIMKKLSDSGIF